MWAYKHNPEAWLKDLADLVIKSSFNWLDYYSCFPYPRPTGFYYDWKSYIDKFSKEIYNSSWYHGTHGVNVAMGLKMALLQAYFSGDPDPKELLLRAIANLQVFHGTANGMFNCSEHLAGNDPTQGVELCTIVEYLYSLELMLPWFDGTEIGDILETVAYNALPASMTADMSGHQYLQQVNQIMCTEAERPWYNNNPDSNIFGLEPHFGCCTANLHQGWPKLVSSCWMRLNDNGVVAAVFAPCAFDFVTANGKKCTIQELTNYPFDEKISFVFSCDDNVDFLFMLRIPSWCDAAEIILPGGEKMNPAAGQYFEAGRHWHNGDTVEVRLPFTLRTTYWQNNSVSLSYGPLVLSLKMDEVWTKTRGEDPFPYWEVRSPSPWNYALILDKSGIPCFRVINNSIAEQPFSAENPPFVIEVPAKRIPEWKEQNNSAGVLPPSPVSAKLCSGEVETIKLIPYGAAKLRITQFPYIEQET
jgi:hypothetical protein